jgi:hypothetical protein
VPIDVKLPIERSKNMLGDSMKSRAFSKGLVFLFSLMGPAPVFG